MAPMLPRNLRPGAEVFGVRYFEGAYYPCPVGRVRRVTRDGYELHNGRRIGFTECPLFTSLEAATTWARANPPKMPTAPGAS